MQHLPKDPSRPSCSLPIRPAAGRRTPLFQFSFSPWGSSDLDACCGAIQPGRNPAPLDGLSKADADCGCARVGLSHPQAETADSGATGAETEGSAMSQEYAWPAT